MNTDKILHILQHSLGLDAFGRGTEYRNHFVAGGKDVELCDEALALGYMRRNDRLSGSDIAGGDPVYQVTREGKEFIAKNSPKVPKRTKSQERYTHWCEVRDCFPDWSFRDWLKAGGYKLEVVDRWLRESEAAYESRWGGLA